MRRPEQDFQITLCQALALTLPKDAVFFAIPNAARRSFVDGKMQRKAGLRKGVPDMVVIHGGKAFFLELKARDGRVSTDQKDMINLLKIAGAKATVVRTVEQALDALREWGVPLRIAK